MVQKKENQTDAPGSVHSKSSHFLLVVFQQNRFEK